ncbi:MAG TPA: DUF3887 domain-containing protein, partial [Isosphaeraceae bacterium]|nr:DUF3887 domain-containing protein [Isosphaeraceae bacterium]
MARHLGFLLVGFALAVNPADEAGRFLENCRKGNFVQAASQFDPKLLMVISADHLTGIWNNLLAQAGPLKGSLGAPRVEKRGTLSTVKVRCPFEKSPLDAMITLNTDGKLVGLLFVPPEDHEAAKRLAPYDDPSKYEEREVTVGAEGWPLQGTLTLPKGASSSTLVVFVHGSGPNDRDENLGPNAP